MEKEFILSEIERTARENGGKPLGKNKFSKMTGVKEHDWYGVYWAAWGDALREAGYQPNEFNKAIPKDELILKFIELMRELGKYPVSGEVRMKARNDPLFPSHSAFDKGLGNKANRIAKVLQYCHENEGYEDVQAICESMRQNVKSISQESETGDGIEPLLGEVYLMKSGKHYKIGFSKHAGKREYELGIQLPESIKTIHILRTDDPVGIEKYWHRRFAEKRLNGEWFNLTKSDVAAFCRRKGFM